MKKLLTLLFLLCSQYIFAQTYIPMPFEDGMLWRQHSTSNISMGYIENRLNGDTIIAGKIYKKVYWNFYQDPSSMSFWMFGKIQFKAVREDTINKKVYAYYTGDSLIYDFSLHSGDTIHSYLLAEFRAAGIDTIRVGQIDSVLINGIYHKRFISIPIVTPINLPQVYHYIEGIGSTEGFLSTNMVFEGEEHLICVGKIYNQSLYPDSTANCIYATSIKENGIDSSIFIFPNPSSDYLNIKSSISNLHLIVRDICGRVILEEKNSMGKIKINKWIPGLYTIQFYSKDEFVATKKFIKE